MKARTLLLVELFVIVGEVKTSAQETMTMEQAIIRARVGSVQALEARQAFISTYWAWRAYQASRLPSLYLYGNLGNFNRSLALLQSPDDGAMKYVSTYNLQNGVGLQARQKIVLTGGTLDVYTDLNRIDQFGINRGITWYTQPVTLSYRQPLFAFNQFKWDKLIEPKEYERGRRTYLETMERIASSAVTAYFDLLSSYEEESISRKNYDNMHEIARERLALGSITRDEYLQLELRMLNDSIAINDCAIKVREAQMVLNSLLGYAPSQEIVPVLEENLPVFHLDYEWVLDKALANSRFNLSHEIEVLNARAAVEKAKAERGITMSFNARFGLTKSGVSLQEAFVNPLDQEVFGLSFSLPIFDWGQGRGRIEKARAAEEVVKAQVQQEENDFRRKIFTTVGQFNNQRNQCSVSRRAANIADERYGLMMDKFRRGTATVLELNTARSESDNARKKYISDVGSFWVSYYTLRQYTLYDFIAGKDIVINEKEML